MIPNRRSISMRLTLGLIVTIILFVVVQAGLQYYSQSRTERQEIEQRADEYADDLAKLLAVPMWTLDNANVRHIGTVYKKNEMMAQLVVADTRGNIIFEMSASDPPYAVSSRTRTIVYGETEIGTVKLSLSLAPYQRDRRTLLYTTLGTLVLTLLVLVAATGILLRVFMNKPLTGLERAMDGLANGDFTLDPSATQYTELEGIFEKFKNMAMTIQNREQALTEVNETLVREVGERRRAQEALALSESTLKAIFSAAPIGIGLVKNRVIHWPNPNFCNMVGYTAEELEGMSAMPLYESKEEFERVGWEKHPAMLQHGTGTVETRMKHKDGEIIDVIMSSSLIDSTDPEAGMTFTVMDITSRKQAEEALAERESTLQSILAGAPIAIGMVRGRRVVWTNESMSEITRYDHDELVGASTDFLYASQVHFEQAGRELYEGLKDFSYCESKWRRKDGRTIDVLISISPVLDGEETTGHIFTIMDITARKQAEKALRLSEQRLDLAMTATSDGVWDWNMLSNAIYFSPSFFTMLGYEPGELPGKLDTWLALIHPEDKDRIYAHVRESVATKHNEFSIEFRMVGKDARIHWILARGMVAERTEDGKPARIVGTHQDITERRDAQEMREGLIRELEEKNSELERFTYTVSHDLKSPLITIKGFLGMLGHDLKGGDDDRIAQDMDRIGQAADKMEQLLNELLELSRVGRLTNPPETIDLGELAEEAAELVAGRLAEAGAEVVVHPGLPTVMADRPRILEVFQNLIDNASKFFGDQPAPRIDIGVRKGDETVIYVRDNGIGIKPQYFDKVFGLFNQLDTDHGGTGIGLALVKRVVETHGGRIWVESEGLGKGTTFCLTLPENQEES